MPNAIMCCPLLNCFSFVWLYVTPWISARQAALSTGFSMQQYWSGLPCPPPGDLPYPGIKPVSLMSPVLAAGSLPLTPPGKPNIYIYINIKSIQSIYRLPNLIKRISFAIHYPLGLSSYSILSLFRGSMMLHFVFITPLLFFIVLPPGLAFFNLFFHQT